MENAHAKILIWNYVYQGLQIGINVLDLIDSPLG